MGKTHMSTSKIDSQYVGVSVDPAGEPFHLKANHVDGPMLVTSDRVPVWLSYLERLQLRFGLTTLQDLNDKHVHRLNRPSPARRWPLK